jgi:hypothetical protein
MRQDQPGHDDPEMLDHYGLGLGISEQAPSWAGPGGAGRQAPTAQQPRARRGTSRTSPPHSNTECSCTECSTRNAGENNSDDGNSPTTGGSRQTSRGETVDASAWEDSFIPDGCRLGWRHLTSLRSIEHRGNRLCRVKAREGKALPAPVLLRQVCRLAAREQLASARIRRIAQLQASSGTDRVVGRGNRRRERPPWRSAFMQGVAVAESSMPPDDLSLPGLPKTPAPATLAHDGLTTPPAGRARGPVAAPGRPHQAAEGPHPAGSRVAVSSVCGSSRSRDCPTPGRRPGPGSGCVSAWSFSPCSGVARPTGQGLLSR